MRGKLVHRVTPDDVGSRVTVRRWEDEPGGPTRDLLGELVAYDDGVLAVDTRRGRETVHEDSVAASKTIPPPPEPRPPR